nr:probable protein phosphatase 2C 11 [Tanacetum cinerariifolium]
MMPGHIWLRLCTHTFAAMADGFWNNRFFVLFGVIKEAIAFHIRSKSARFNYGYASFKGKRASMKDYFETTISEVDGRMVVFFGVFDGHGGSRTAEYLKKNLFKNLSGHPGFIKDTKNTIGHKLVNLAVFCIADKKIGSGRSVAMRKF